MVAQPARPKWPDPNRVRGETLDVRCSHLILVTGIALAACSDREAGNPPGAVGEAIRQAQETARGHRGPHEMPAVDLEAWFPAEFLGMPRGPLMSRDTSAAGIRMVVTRATYARGTRQVELVVTDAGTAAALTPAASHWALLEYDRGSGPEDYERTIRFEQFKGLEESARRSGQFRSELSLLVTDRFVVRLNGREIEMADLKTAVAVLRLRELAAAEAGR